MGGPLVASGITSVPRVGKRQNPCDQCFMRSKVRVGEKRYMYIACTLQESLNGRDGPSQEKGKLVNGNVPWPWRAATFIWNPRC